MVMFYYLASLYALHYSTVQYYTIYATPEYLYTNYSITRLG